MVARKAPYPSSDVTRAIAGAEKAGMKVGRVELDPETGRIVMFAAGEKPVPQTDLDKWLEKQDARSA